MRKRAENAWKKAAACEAHAEKTADPKLKEKFLRLHQSWVRVAIDAQFQSDMSERLEKSA